MAEHQNHRDPDAGKGATEGEHGNTSLVGQNPHRTSSQLVKANDTDFPEPGNNPEHSGEAQEGFSQDRQGRPHQKTGVAQRGSTLSHTKPGARNQNSNALGVKRAIADREPEDNPAEGADIRAHQSPEREIVNQDPGERQKELHNDEKDDPLAA